MSPKEHVDDISSKDKSQLEALHISFDRFMRTTDLDHIETAQSFFKKSFEAGDIYKGNYEGYYCEGCEAYKTLTELTSEGKCPLHLTREIQRTTEENYFFKWEKYSSYLSSLLDNPGFVLPEGKRKEMQSFVLQGIKDLPVTRPTYKVSWGIQSPVDASQVIYVWFDALINYYTGSVHKGFWNEDTQIVHLLGKDNARWHALLWPAMLKSVGLKVPDTVYVHGYITLNGEKISKSRGNIVRPSDLISRFGVDPVRYYFLRYGPIVEDVDISDSHMIEIYNASLANGLGNTVSRIAKLAERSGFEFPIVAFDPKYWQGTWANHLNDCRTDLLLNSLWAMLSDLDKHLNENTPWSQKDENILKDVLTYEVNEMRKIGTLLEPFMPETSKKILMQFGDIHIKSTEGLFPRLA
jgi:methionyl-tRNA synthetase